MSAQKGGTTLLIVEDEPVSRKQAVMALSKLADVSILEAPDGDKASDILREEAVDLMVLDLHLPTVSGLDLLHLIRAGEFKAPADLPVVVVTGANDIVAERIAGAMGVDAFLHKPAKAPELRQAVLDALAKARTKA